MRYAFPFQDLLPDHEIKKSRDIGGKNPLLLCAFSGGSSDTIEKKQQWEGTKKRRLSKALDTSNRTDIEKPK